MKTVVLISVLSFFSVLAFAQDLPKGAIQFKQEDVKWMDAPLSLPLPPGSKIAILEGSPKSEGIFTIRVMLQPYIKVPAHTHPKDERVTVISGIVYVGFGDVLDTTNANRFSEGSYYLNPVGAPHYVFTQSEGVTIQITSFGPWGLDYLKEEKK
jgi:quercetin dioxygenase-like cupin family protein